VSTTGQDSKSPPVSLGTAAVWRRRQEACSEIVSPDGTEDTDGAHIANDLNIAGTDCIEGPANGGKAKRDLAANGSARSINLEFVESQQAGLIAMMSIAKVEANSQPPSPAETSGQNSNSAVVELPPATAQLPAKDQFAPAAVTAVTSDVPASPTGSLNRGSIRSNRGRAQIPRISLAFILTAQAVLSLRLVWSNTAFPDEALYLWAGHLEWAHWMHGTPLPTPNFTTFFSGAPILYPPLGALADSVGGLAVARLLSLCFMLNATLLLHGVTRRLFDRSSAVFAAALFAGLSATQYLGAFATYDAMALLLLTLATWLGVRAACCRLGVHQFLLTACAAGALALADATKYAAALFDPIVIAVIGLAAWRSKGWKRGVLGILTVIYSLGILLVLGIHLGGRDYWQGITTTTLERSQGTDQAIYLLVVSGKWVGLIALLAIFGTIATACNGFGRASTILAGILTAAVFLVPAEQARIHTYTSLFKHVGFGGWFACIPAGYALASLARAAPRAKATYAVRVGVTLVCIAAIPSISWARSHYGWPNTSQLIPQMRAVLASTHGPVLADDRGNILDYYLPAETANRQVSGTFFFAYYDPVTGAHLSGAPAYAAAIHDSYFSVIMLEFWDTAQTDDLILRDLETSGGYRLIATVPYSATGQHGNAMIWVREDVR
jgi:4-amino-4-deoxy-L-arabinose transferase-like glycosyltransferase